MNRNELVKWAAEYGLTITPTISEKDARLSYIFYMTFDEDAGSIFTAQTLNEAETFARGWISRIEQKEHENGESTTSTGI